MLAMQQSAVQAFDIQRMQPIADRNVRTGNKVLYEKPEQIVEPANSAAADVGNNWNDDYLDVNEIPVRYDEAQLWRIYNISQAMRHNAIPLAETLENKFGKYLL